MPRTRKAGKAEDYILKVRHGRLVKVHKDIIRWRRRKKHLALELEKAKAELEALTTDRREYLHKRLSTAEGEDHE